MIGPGFTGGKPGKTSLASLMEKDVILVPLLAKNLGAEATYFRIPAFGQLKQASPTSQWWGTTIADESSEALDLIVQPHPTGIRAIMANASRACGSGNDLETSGVEAVAGGAHGLSIAGEALKHWNRFSVCEPQPLRSKLLADHERGELEPTYRRHDG